MEKDKNVNNRKDYSEVLNKINISLYIIVALLCVNLVLNVIYKNSGNTNITDGNDSVENSNENLDPDYDVSKYKAINYKEFKEEIKNKDYTVVYFGREGCHYCTSFLPVMNKVQEDYGFKHLYFDVTQILNFETNQMKDEKAYNEIIAIDNFFKENFFSTPMIAVFKKGKFVKGTVGYTEYDAYAHFIEDAGLKKK